MNKQNKGTKKKWKIKITFAIFLITITLIFVVIEMKRDCVVLNISVIPEEFKKQNKGYSKEVFENNIIHEIKAIRNKALRNGDVQYI